MLRDPFRGRGESHKVVGRNRRTVCAVQPPYSAAWMGLQGSIVLAEGSRPPPSPTLLAGILLGSCVFVLSTLFLWVVPALCLSPGPYRASE